jgi:hypothetical protein
MMYGFVLPDKLGQVLGGDREQLCQVLEHNMYFVGAKHYVAITGI